jgi:hypothetical protein
MTRRIFVVLAALLGGLALLAVASPASAQVGLPFTFDLGAFLQAILASIPPFLHDFFAATFAAIFNAFCGFFNTCAS